MSTNGPRRMLYRYRSFAERLGPSNAKSILLHYVGVLTLSGLVFKARLMLIAFCNKCDDPLPTDPPLDIEDPTLPHYSPTRGHPYWFSALCTIRNSDNFFAYYFRFYMDFTAYYITIFAAAFNTIIMLVLAKHLYRALYVKDEGFVVSRHDRKGQYKDKVVATRQGQQSLHNTNNNNNHVEIEMTDEQTALIEKEEVEGCYDDNFCIEVILATFDFFRVSETKID